MLNYDFVVYALCEPDSPTEVRYIGESIGGAEERFLEHIYASKDEDRAHYHVYRWITKLRREGKVPVLRTLEAGFESEKELKEAEKGYIAQYRMLGYRLTNMTDGGEGTTGYKHTLQTRVEIAISNMETSSKSSVSRKGPRKKPAKKPKISLELRLKMKERAKNNKYAPSVKIIDSDGVSYHSLKAAAEANGVSRFGIKHSIKKCQPMFCLNKTFRYAEDGKPSYSRDIIVIMDNLGNRYNSVSAAYKATGVYPPKIERSLFSGGLIEVDGYRFYLPDGRYELFFSNSTIGGGNGQDREPLSGSEGTTQDLGVCCVRKRV